jgi:hypothetical protein
MIGIATVEAINKLIGQKDGFLTILKENIETVISETDNNIVAEIDKKLEVLRLNLIE